MIGLGAMGSGMARNLARAGFLTAVWNRTASKAQALASELGVSVVASPAELAAQVELVIVCVSADDDVLAVVEALSAGIRPGSIVVDTSTVSVETARTAAQRLAERGVAFLDAPVSGGVEGARSGTLVMMVGGDTEVLERARPVLSVLTRQIVHFGVVGAGQGVKAVNQLMAAGINQAVTESLALAEALQLPMDKVVEIIAGGAAGNWFLAHRGLTMTQGHYAPGFKIALHYKDLLICEALARRVGVSSPVLQASLQDYQRLIAQGCGEEDISALYRLKRQFLPSC